jgi:hypothetical protein
MNFRNVFFRLTMVTTLAVVAMSAAHARVVPASAKSFLTAIYQAYIGNSAQSAKGVSLTDPDAIRRYFSPGLASLILEDGAGARGPGNTIVLGDDPFVGRESWDIADLAVDVKETGPAKAVGTVSFTNFGKPEKVVLELLKVGADWRIAEIKWGPLTLRSIYRKKWEAALGGGPVPK